MRKKDTDIEKTGKVPETTMLKMENTTEVTCEEKEMLSEAPLPPQTSKTSHSSAPSGNEVPKTQLNWKPTPLEDWWDSQDVKTRFHFSERTLCTMREKKLLPYAIVGGRCFYRAEDLKKLFDDSFRRLNPELAASEANKMQSTFENDNKH